MKGKIQLIILPFLLSSVCLVKSQTWNELGAGGSELNVTAANLSDVTSDSNGNIYTAGGIYDANRTYLAKWTGTSWIKIADSAATGNNNNVTYALCSDPSGNIYTTGVFGTTTVAAYVAKFNGSTWTNIYSVPSPTNTNWRFFTLCADASGNIYAAGTYTNGPSNCVVKKWNGTIWSNLGNGPSISNFARYIYSLCSDAAGNIYAAGDFKNSSGKCYVAKWDGTNWSELGTGINSLNANNWIYSVRSDAAGNIYAAGKFTNDSLYSYVAKWNGTNWAELGAGGNSLKANDLIRTICPYSGGIYAAGNFRDSTYTYNYVAKWDGTKWSNFGNLNVEDQIFSICKDPTGNVYAVGNFINNNNFHYVSKYSVGPTAINENEKSNNELGLYPNPNEGKFFIKLENSFTSSGKPITLSVINQLGQMVFTQKVTYHNQPIDNKIEIDLGKMLPGIYYLTYENSESITSKKFVIKGD